VEIALCVGVCHWIKYFGALYLFYYQEIFFSISIAVLRTFFHLCFTTLINFTR
jgi:hypothetical protein